MSPLTSRTAVLFAGGETQFRRQFTENLRQLVGDIRFLWMPNRFDGATSYSSETPTSGRAITWTKGAITKQGHGYLQTFDGSTHFGLSPDTANLTFGNGITDQAFSVVVLTNITDTAGERVFVSKWNSGTSQREWLFEISGVDKLKLQLYDETAGKTVQRLSDAVVSQSALHVYAGTYDGTGGATAMNGATVYVDGVAQTSTATNDALYVAMGNKTAGCQIAGVNAAATVPAQGTMGLVMVSAGVLSAANLLKINTYVNQFYGTGF